jgi:hypothetical protein
MTNLHGGALLMPCFHRKPQEAAIIGRIIAAFGEIEFMLGLCLGEAIADRHSALRAMFRLLSDRGRIDMADALARPAYSKIGLATEFDATMATIRNCRIIRNQYAHCHYADSFNESGLYFTSLTGAAETLDSFEYQWRHVDMALLTLQEGYFLHTTQRLQFLEWEYQFRSGQKTQAHGLPSPTEQELPPKHNPPSQHIPQWISEEAKRRHLELALEWEYTAGLQQRPQKQPKKPKLSSRARRDAALKRAKKS